MFIKLFCFGCLVLITNLNTTILKLSQDEDFREWTSKDGKKKIEARLEAYDDASNKVMLVRRNGSKFTTDKTNLSLLDQEYLDARSQPGNGAKPGRVKLGSEQVAKLAQYGLKYSSGQIKLDDTRKLSSGLAAARKLRQKLRKMEKAFTTGEKQLEGAKEKLRQLIREDGALSAQLANASSSQAKIRIVGLSDALRAEAVILADDIRKIETQRDQARGEVTQFKGEYIESIVALRRNADQLKSKYAQLKDDENLNRLLSEISAQTGTELSIKPDASYQRLVKQLVELEGQVVSENVPLRAVANTWMIEVTINSKTVEMILDTGASSICLPHNDAVKLGLAPNKEAPVVPMRIASGAIIEGRKIVIPSVRVGKFSADNVECVVLPPSAVRAPRLLGNSFLKHFNLDLKAGDRVLQMQKIKD